MILPRLREGERAMDVFHHPFAYAHWHRVDTGALRPDGEAEPAGFLGVSLAA